MVEALFADQGRLEDPHLWDKAAQLGLDVDRFAADLRSDSVAAAVDLSFRSAIRAGVITSPTLLLGEQLFAGVPDQESLHSWSS